MYGIKKLGTKPFFILATKSVNYPKKGKYPEEATKDIYIEVRESTKNWIKIGNLI